MIENRDWIFDGIGAALIILFATWIVPLLSRSLRLKRDGRKIYNWLESNTLELPGESHKSLSEISIGTRLPEERIQEACLQNNKIFQSVEKPKSYSIWRAETQSVYEKRGVSLIG
ncbi:MAG TPA: hypothetical protein DCX53_00965 [Anaerolineae bacterium]|nr:hypothetical protein [Anaerolineae bacterium]